MKNLLRTICLWGLAVPFVVFGLNKFLGFAEMPPPADETAQKFLGAMFTSYLGKLVGVTEIIGGIFLLVPRTRLLGLVLCGSIVVNIVFFHLAHDLPGNGIWILSTSTFIGCLIFYKDEVKRLFNN
jgi:uncharacterized membrane protein YphA (DoxX/SURF4 family)